ncbi:MAG TPA: OmpA family protein [Cytophagaceae bacterium]|jgi:outer membrane protein OmpA-like peptidoglycan-associated protein|nr:OmpA family protein [Cytophagaceae bacterium]
MKKILFLLVTILTGALVVQGQSSFIAKKLGPAVNSEYTDINPVLDPSGKTLYFNRVNHPENTFGKDESMDIWYSQWINDSTWTVAKRMPFPFNTARSNSITAISTDGKEFLISGIFSKKKIMWLSRGLSIVTKTGDDTWSRPKMVNVPGYAQKNRGTFSNSSMSADGKTLLLCFTKKWRKDVLDLYISRKSAKGKWGKPKKMRDINDYGSIEAPFLSVDNKFLYFSANQFRGEEFDIMRVSRMDDTYQKWSAPVVLSDSINSTAFDSYYKTNLKGSWAYFCSDKNGNTKEDIYKIKIFEENPFIVLSGIVYNTTKNAPIASKYTFTIMADGKPVDSVMINPDSATYKLKLPLGRKYYLKPDAKNFIGTQEIIDVADVREYTEKVQNLKLTPLPYILVQGKLLDRKTNTKLPASSLPRVAMDGVITDSVVIDIANGTYQIKVPHGSNHSLQVLADKFTPDIEYLNLNNIDEYQVMNKNLYATKINLMAVLSGKILSRKSNKPLPYKVDTKIKLNEVVFENAKINKTTGEYSMEIPLGQAYIVNAAASKYFPVFESIDLSRETESVKIFKDLYLSPLEVGSSVKLNNVFFESGKSTLKEESFVELDKVVAFLNEYVEVKIEIGGHTDNVGKPDKNLKLSDARAKAVADYIEGKGIADDRISSKGYGQTKPVVPNTTPANKAKNRRVEFTILDL